MQQIQTTYENKNIYANSFCLHDFDIIRQNFYTASNLKDLFHNIHPKHNA